MDTEPVSLLTREIFGNVSQLSKALFYGVSLVSVGLFAWGVRRRIRLWRMGKVMAKSLRWRTAAANVLRYVVFQTRVRGRGRASIAHGLLFGGFFVLFVGTLLVAIEHLVATALGRQPHDPVFHKGVYYAVFEVALDTAGLAMLMGCAYFVFRRLRRPKDLGHEARDWLVLALLGMIGVTGYATEGLRMIREPTPLPGISYVGYLFASLFQMFSVARADAVRWHVALWWVHAAISLLLIALVPYSRLLHAVAGAIRLAAGVDRLGALPAVSLEQVEETGEIGANRVDQFTRRQLIELDACVSCARCEQACPAFESGKPLSPRDVVQDIRRQLRTPARDMRGPIARTEPSLLPSLAGDVIAEEAIWSCTTCSACVDVCPLGVNPLGFIAEFRRYLVADARLRGSPALALQRTDRSGNPWGLSALDRLSWAEGLSVPTAVDNPDFEILYWVGCAAAYDRRLQRVARSMVKLLSAARLNFAVLGSMERCTGEAARRMGDELLFQQLARENIETFSRFGMRDGAKRIVSHCPHCVNSFRLDYSQMNAHLNVVHHSELLAELVRAGRLKSPQGQGSRESVTYHDPCYLARVWETTEAPREILTHSLAANLVEMDRHGRQTACCGAGGGRMWFDDAPETRIGQSRINEALATGATTLAVSCPFCLIMTSDGLAARGGAMAVRDVAEILADTIVDGE